MLNYNELLFDLSEMRKDLHKFKELWKPGKFMCELSKSWSRQQGTHSFMNVSFKRPFGSVEKVDSFKMQNTIRNPELNETLIQNSIFTATNEQIDLHDRPLEY